MIFLPQQNIQFTRDRFLIALGDSFTVGSNASPISGSFINQIVATRVISLRNFAVGGRGVWNQAAALNLFNVVPPGFNKHVTFISNMSAFNDLRRAGGGPKTLKKIEACYRSVMLNGILDSPVFPGDTVTKTGGISTFNCQTFGGRATNGASSTGTDSWTWSFTGSEFGIQFIASDGVAADYGTAQIFVDNVLIASVNTDNWYDGINDGANANDRGPLGLMYHGFTTGTHTVRVDSQGDGRVVVDFFATLLPPVFCSAFLFWEIPYMTPTGYLIPPADQSSITISDSGSAVIQGLVTELQNIGRRAAYVPTNSFYNLGTDVDVDDVHPNNLGHTHLANAAASVTF